MQINSALILNEIDIKEALIKYIKSLLDLYFSQTKKITTKHASLRKLFFPILIHWIKTGEDKIINSIILFVFLLKIKDNKIINGINAVNLINQVVLSWKKKRFEKSPNPKRPWLRLPSIKCELFIQNLYG